MRISPVLKVEQNGVPIYTFALTVTDLLQVGAVRRFSETQDGVQRMLDETHRDNMTVSMNDPQVLFMEPIMGDLVGAWTYDAATSTLVRGDGAYISIEDGGHRFEASKQLSPEQQAHFQFIIAVTDNLPYERRVALFRQQMLRKKIDPRLILQQRYRIGDWANKREEEAYGILVELNGQPSSPLYQLILLEEQVRRPGGHRTEGINAMSLKLAIERFIGNKSPLATYTPAQRMQILLNIFATVKELWPDEWKNTKRYLLKTGKGLSAILQLVVKGAEFRGAIGDKFDDPRAMHDALFMAGRYDWSKDNNTGRVAEVITAGLDETIGRAKRRQRTAAKRLEPKAEE